MRVIILVPAVLLSLAVGCAQRQTHDVPLSGEPGSLVVSGTPTADTAAFRTAQRSLLTARHGVIEDLGPDPIWDRWNTPRNRALRDAEAAGHPDDGRPAGAAEGEMSLTGDDAALAGAQLPATVVRHDLGEDRIRLIWQLRSFGGPTVTSGTPGQANTRREVSLETADLEPLMEIVRGLLGENGEVLALPNENRLIITCNGDMEEEVIHLLEALDVPAPQVEITAKIFEVSHNFDYQQGARILLNRIAEDGTQQALSSFQTERLLDSIEDQAPFQGSVVSLLQTFENAGVSVDASFEILAESGLIHVVSSPRLTVAQGRTGYMLAGQELPIQSIQIHNNAVRTSTEYKPVGVQLYITPKAIGDGLIKLHTTSIVSSVSGFTPLPAIRGGRQSPLLFNPIIESREAETAVTVTEGETLVISGMRMVRTTTREDKVPLLGDLPLLGNLFKSHRSQQHMTDLYFFVTPTLATVEHDPPRTTRRTGPVAPEAPAQLAEAPAADPEPEAEALAEAEAASSAEETEAAEAAEEAGAPK